MKKQTQPATNASKPRILAGSLALILIALFSSEIFLEENPPENSTIKSEIHRTPTLSSKRAPPPLPAPPGSPSSHKSQDFINHFRNSVATAMTDENPFALAVRAREQRGKSGFPLALYITEACWEARGALSYFKNPNNAREISEILSRHGADAGKHMAQQALAAQRIESRCGPFSDTELDKPLPDDKDGQKYANLRKELLDFSRYPVGALVELSNQGQLENALMTLFLWRRFEGERFVSRQDQELFFSAIHIAAFRVTSRADQQALDLRVMTSCLNFSVCDGSYESGQLRMWPPGSTERQRVLELASRIQQAFLLNDLNAFLPRKR